jgi:hypothetical protein
MVENGNTRQRNLLMLLYAMDAAGEATAAYLAEQTGLSVATISRGLSLLKAKKLVVQRRKDTTEVGRRPDVFSINGAYAHCMYCCLDGDSLRGYLLDLRGKVVARHAVDADSAMTAEDFAFYQRCLPGMFLFLGTGDGPALHTCNFDFDERILEKGASLFETLAVNFK